jgi:glutathione S-transferase
MHLYSYPVSTYSQKALIALYEKGIRFTPHHVNLADPQARAEYRKLYPLGKVPLLVDEDRTIPESSILIEYIDQRFEAGPRLIPVDAESARRVRFHDRMFDLYLNESALKVFFDGRKPPEKRDPEVVARAQETIDVLYQYMDGHFAKNAWAYGDAFSLADCAAAPPLALLQNQQPFTKYERVTAYWKRLAERPSVARVLAEAKAFLEAAATSK